MKTLKEPALSHPSDMAVSSGRGEMHTGDENSISNSLEQIWQDTCRTGLGGGFETIDHIMSRTISESRTEQGREGNARKITRWSVTGFEVRGILAPGCLEMSV